MKTVRNVASHLNLWIFQVNYSQQDDILLIFLKEKKEVCIRIHVPMMHAVWAQGCRQIWGGEGAVRQACWGMKTLDWTSAFLGGDSGGLKLLQHGLLTQERAENSRACLSFHQEQE